MGQRVVRFLALNLCFIPNHCGPVSYIEDRNFENSCNGNIDDSGFWQETHSKGVSGDHLMKGLLAKQWGGIQGSTLAYDSRKPLPSIGLTEQELFCRRQPPDRCCGPRCRLLVGSLRSMGSEKKSV